MTRSQLLRRLASWQRVLGLSEWRVVVDFDEPAADGAQATIGVPRNAFDATIRLAAEWREWGDRETDEVLVHELLHLALRDMDEAAERGPEKFSEGTWNVWVAQWSHATEVFINRMARAIVALVA